MRASPNTGMLVRMSKDKPRVATIVLTWNSADFVAQALTSLQKSSYPTDVLVVDNDSHDNTAELISNKFPNIAQLQTGDNYGYAGGNNRGVKHIFEQCRKSNAAKPDYIFILNPDAYVDKDCIKTLVERMESEPELAVVSPKIYHAGTNDIWYAGMDLTWRNGGTVMNHGIDNGQFDNNKYTDLPSGCAMLIRSHIFDKVGLFDERFFLYYEETDWATRCKKLGNKIGIQHDAIAHHHASASTGGFSSPLYQYYTTRNKLLFVRNQRPLYMPIVLLYSFISSFEKIRAENHHVSAKSTRVIRNAMAKGYLDFFLGRFGRQNIPS